VAKPAVGGWLALEPPTIGTTMGALLGWRLKMKRKRRLEEEQWSSSPPELITWLRHCSQACVFIAHKYMVQDSS
jgi:membrane protein YqaA with SNARE-associated domain